MKEYYYNYFDKDGLPAITVCVLYNGKDAARGVAVLNYDDVWDELEGKTIAKRYALRVLKRRPIDGFVKYSVVDTLLDCNCPFTQKGELNPALSFKEAKSIFGKPRMGDYYRRFSRVTYEINLENMEAYKVWCTGHYEIHCACKSV